MTKVKRLIAILFIIAIAFTVATFVLLLM